MKKLLGLLLFCFCINGMAQSINFEYDTAGNQIKRQYTSTGRYSSESTKEYKDITNEDLKKFFHDDVISYYPNPVKDELYLKWKLNEDKKVTSIDIYNIICTTLWKRRRIIIKRRKYFRIIQEIYLVLVKFLVKWDCDCLNKPNNFTFKLFF